MRAEYNAQAANRILADTEAKLRVAKERVAAFTKEFDGDRERAEKAHAALVDVFAGYARRRPA